MKTVVSAVTAAVLSFSALHVSAADLKINGFATFAAGTTLNEYEVGDFQATFEADQPTNGVYDDSFSYRPESLYGLQVTSDIGKGLSVVGQIVGIGSENYNAKIVWAYAKYEANDNVEFLFGRQRLPLYFYSDVLDVGYSYHWMRPPTDGALPTDILDGVQARYEFQMGNWDTRIQAFTGESLSEESIGLNNLYGVVAYTSNDWLQLRASAMEADGYFDNAAHPQNEDNPFSGKYYSVSAYATLGNAFVVAEATTNTTSEPIFPFSLEGYDAFFVSAGYQMGDFTPHITYSQQGQKVNVVDFTTGTTVLTDTFRDNSITAGLRWDFHNKAAFKIEFQHRADSDKEARAAVYGGLLAAGLTTENLAIREVDLFSMGIDVIF